MEYNSTVMLKDGRACTLRNGTAADGQAILDVFNLTHEQTDYLLTYPGEHGHTAQQEADFLKAKTDSTDEIELLAELDGKVVGSAGIGCVGRKEKIRHRAELGISVDKAYWGLGIGRALTEACIECAKKRDMPNWNWKSWQRTEPLFRCMRVWASWSTAEIPRAFVPAIPAGKRSCSCGWIWRGKRMEKHYHMPKVEFHPYLEEDYEAVCTFLIALNRNDKKHINWNWARFEWMMEHPEFDKSTISSIGLW